MDVLTSRDVLTGRDVESSRRSADFDERLRRLSSSPLGRMGGVVVLDDLPSARISTMLAREALRCASGATRQTGRSHRVDDGRHDVAGRSLGSGAGGPVQDDLYASPALRRRLEDLCSGRVKPSGARGSFSYYTRPGDHLDTHVDIVTCDVTVITVVQDSTPHDDPGGSLEVYSNCSGAPLSSAHQPGVRPTAIIKAPQASSVVILGGLVPHGIVPLGEHGTRVISALCFEAVD